LIKAFPENAEIQILNGRFGPYIKAGKKNVKIPKGKEPASLTLEECIVLADATPEKKGRFGRRAAAPAAEAKPATEKKVKPVAAKKVKAAPVKKANPAKKSKKVAAKKTTKTPAKKKK
jgi:DNA topoisomerase-1